MADLDNTADPKGESEESPSPSDFGKALRVAREEKGLTLSGLAERSGVAIRTITACERGETASPRPKIVARLALALGAIPENWLELAGRQLPREAIERLAAEISSAAESPGQEGSSVHKFLVGEDAVVELLEKVSKRDCCDELVIHIHSAIGFYTAKYHRVAASVLRCLENGVRVLYIVSERWRDFRADDVLEELREAVGDIHAASKSGSPAFSKQLFVALEPVTEQPPTMSSLFLRVAGVSKLRSDPGKGLDAGKLQQSDLTECWVEVTNDLSGGYDLEKSHWFVAPNVAQYNRAFKGKWRELQNAAIPIRPLFDEEYSDDDK